MKWFLKEDDFDLTEQMIQAFPEKYTKDDLHRDFVQTFKGSPIGLRVLQQILKWGKIYGSTVPAGKNAVDSNAVLINEGERRLALKILSTVNVEPKQGKPPTRVTYTEKKNG